MAGLNAPLSLLDACRAVVTRQERALIDELLATLPTSTEWSDRRKWCGHGVVGNEAEYNRRFELVGNVDTLLESALQELVADRTVRIVGFDLAAPYTQVTIPSAFLTAADRIDWRKCELRSHFMHVVGLRVEMIEPAPPATKTAKKSRRPQGRPADPRFADADAHVEKLLREMESIPKPGDGKQEALKKEFLEFLAAHDEHAGDSTARDHVKKCIGKVKDERRRKSNRKARTVTGKTDK